MGSQVKPQAAVVSQAEDLVNLAEKHSLRFPPRPCPLRQRRGTGDVVLITGTTRGFGCDVLEHLLREDGVERVYAFNRPGSRAMDRQRASFRQRGLKEDLLDIPKFVMVEADLHIPGFNIEPGLLEEIRQSTTHIIHNAWRVDFLVPLAMFENDFRAIRNLVELSLSSPYSEPPKFLFVGSAATLDRYTAEIPAPEGPVGPTDALGIGYFEAKWVAEQIIHNAAGRAGVPAVIIRVGQLCGDRCGYWNEKEWFPAIVKSAPFTRCLPDTDGSVSFIPSYEAARALVEMRKAHKSTRILHLVHPRRVTWHALISTVADELGVAVVPYGDWLSALQRCASVPGADPKASRRQNPALGLLEYFHTRTFTDRKEPFGSVYVSTENAEAISETLRSLPELNVSTVRRWVAVWRTSGFLAKRPTEYRL